MYEAVAAKEKDLKKQHDDLKKSATKNEKELQSKIKKLEDAQKTASKKLESFQHEDQRLRKEIESLQDQVKNNGNADALNEKVVELQNTIDDKVTFISSLQNQLGQMKDLEGEITRLRKEVNDKATEMSTMRKQLEDMTASSDAAETLRKSKDCEISELLGKLTLVEKERDALHNSQTLADEKQRQLENIHSQKVRTDALISKAEISFRQLGLLTPNQSLFASWDALEGQLEQLVLRSRDPNNTEAGMMKEKSAGKRKRSAPHVDILPDTGLGEGSTREVIYQTCRIRESGPSPVKKAGRPKRVVERKKAKQMDAPAIKPFSQLQNEAPVKLAPGTPAGMKDFDALLFSTPAEPQQEQQQQQVEKIVDTQPTRKSSTEKMLLDEIETRQSQPGDPNHPKLPGQGQRPDSNGNTHIPETQMQGVNSSHHVSQLMPEKGILKDPSSMLLSQTPRAIRTPSNKITGNSSAIEMAVNGAFRRPSRIASKYFDPVPTTKEAPLDTAVPSQAVVADDAQPPRQLRKTRGRYSRKRGE
ncbi:hypothetical protein KEM56_005992 [Ascosphaera pollenicola]|nr:hypothetical protein KEM56_005992 [Ascosphaera pollenicola]